MLSAADEGADRERWPLIFAAGEGDAAAVRDLLASGSDANAKSRDGESALHVAGIKGDPDTVRALLNAGAEVDARTPAGTTMSMTPLHWAIYGGHLQMVEMLLSAGASPTAANEHGTLPLEMAVSARWPEIESLLRAAIQRKEEL